MDLGSLVDLWQPLQLATHKELYWGYDDSEMEFGCVRIGLVVEPYAAHDLDQNASEMAWPDFDAEETVSYSCKGGNKRKQHGAKKRYLIY